MRKYYRAHPEMWQAVSLQRKYGLTLDDYSDLLRKQNGGCAICKTPIGEVKRNRRLFVEHDHKNNRIRGLTCGRCNTAIAFLRDNPEYARTIFHYLTENS